MKKELMMMALCTTLSAFGNPAFAACGYSGCAASDYKATTDYKETVYYTTTTSTHADCHTTPVSDCGNLHCEEPISRATCADPYCFYPPPEYMSQARCCHFFGNIGQFYSESFED